ncbi:MAG: COX15/CtaA family protein [Pyrinomonadaceae bacterium]|nr:COX15/CtaA family protein [Pyrinomonadaceae bacterium]
MSSIKNRKSAIKNMQRGLHRFALLVAGATFFLIIAGALVTSHDAGLATEDWPLSNGQVFPEMVGNLFWEHGHRMVATTVGLLTIGLVILLYRWVFLRFVKRLLGMQGHTSLHPGEPPQWLRRLGLIALVGVIVQGLLGGLTVKLMLPLWVSTAHATLAQLFFCTTVALAVFTSKSWVQYDLTVEEKGTLPIRYVCAAASATILLQLVLGATLRHSATWDKHLPTELLVAHIVGAIAVALILATATFLILRRHPEVKFLTRPATIAMALVGLQLLLGVAAYLTRLKSPDDPQPLHPMVGITVAHVACGALVFATTIVMTLRASRALRSAPSWVTGEVAASRGI